MMKYIFFVLIQFCLFCKIANGQSNDTTQVSVVKTTRKDCCNSSSTSPDSKLSNEFSASSVKNKNIINEEISVLLSEINRTRYHKLIGSEILYKITIDSVGNVIAVKKFRDFYSHKTFSNRIVEYLFKLEFIPGYILDNGIRKNVVSSRLFQIRIMNLVR